MGPRYHARIKAGRVPDLGAIKKVAQRRDAGKDLLSSLTKWRNDFLLVVPQERALETCTDVNYA